MATTMPKATTTVRVETAAAQALRDAVYRMYGGLRGDLMREAGEALVDRARLLNRQGDARPVGRIAGTDWTEGDFVNARRASRRVKGGGR